MTAPRPAPPAASAGERLLWRLVSGDFHWCGAMPLWLVVRVLAEEPGT